MPLSFTMYSCRDRSEKKIKEKKNNRIRRRKKQRGKVNRHVGPSRKLIPNRVPPAVRSAKVKHKNSTRQMQDRIRQIQELHALSSRKQKSRYLVRGAYWYPHEG
eukprot:3885567-Rhodomonas_salina.3